MESSKLAFLPCCTNVQNKKPHYTYCILGKELLIVPFLPALGKSKSEQRFISFPKLARLSLIFIFNLLLLSIKKRFQWNFFPKHSCKVVDPLYASTSREARSEEMNGSNHSSVFRQLVQSALPLSSVPCLLLKFLIEFAGGQNHTVYKFIMQPLTFGPFCFCLN